MNVLKMGIPKGSLENATIALFEKSGWQIKLASRNYFPEVDDPELSCSICRPQKCRGMSNRACWTPVSPAKTGPWRMIDVV
jgi:hypothetical protein